MVVVLILSTIAGAVIASFGGVESSARDDLGASELFELRRAVQRFWSDTGHLPRTGPFALTTDPVPGRVSTADAPWAATGAPTGAAAAAAWLHHPANLWPLYRCPLPATDPLATWNPDTRRGWRGPYVSRAGEGEVVVGDGFDPVTLTWRPVALLHRMPAVADPYPAAPLEGAFTQFEWRPWGSATPYVRHGRPYLLILPGPGQDRAETRLVGLGPDGVYQSADDVSVDVFR